MFTTNGEASMMTNNQVTLLCAAVSDITMMTNDQVALLCAAVSENAYSTAAIIIQAGKFAEALEKGLDHGEQDEDESPKRHGM